MARGVWRTGSQGWWWLGLAAAGAVPWAVGVVPARGTLLYALVVAGVLFGGAVVGRWSPITRSRLALGCLAAVLTLGLADAVLRHVLVGYVYYRSLERLVIMSSVRPDVQRLRPYGRFEGEEIGDLVAMTTWGHLREPRWVRVQADAYGFRNEPGPPPGPYEVIVLGDSVGMGIGTTQERTWVTLLAARVGKPVYNLSFPGAPSGAVVNLALELPRLPTREGTLVLWELSSLNDLDDDYGRLFEPDRFPGESWMWRLSTRVAMYRRGSVIRQLLGRFYRWFHPRQDIVVRPFLDGRQMLFSAWELVRADRSAEAVRAHRNYPALERTVQAMRDLAGRHRLRVVVVAVPSKTEVYRWVIRRDPPWSTAGRPSGFSQALGELVMREDMGFLDLTPAFVEAARRVYETSGELLWWTDDTHFNESGHRVMAELTDTALAALPWGGEGAGGEPP